ncbi:hypothetical protein V1291_004875 [Nitrobacteraceae bacterium AZCC 1564]
MITATEARVRALSCRTPATQQSLTATERVALDRTPRRIGGGWDDRHWPLADVVILAAHVGFRDES